MGQYNLEIDELAEKIEDFMRNLEGDFTLKDFLDISKIVYLKLSIPKNK